MVEGIVKGVTLLSISLHIALILRAIVMFHILFTYPQNKHTIKTNQDVGGDTKMEHKLIN